VLEQVLAFLRAAPDLPASTALIDGRISQACYQSLRRRRERLDSRLREMELLQRGGQPVGLSEKNLDADDLDKAPDTEVEAVEEEVLDQATAARSIAELCLEIGTLSALEAQAQAQVVRRSGNDSKWRELASTTTSRHC
jgi:hypothetical protein